MLVPLSANSAVTDVFSVVNSIFIRIFSDPLIPSTREDRLYL